MVNSQRKQKLQRENKEVNNGTKKEKRPKTC